MSAQQVRDYLQQAQSYQAKADYQNAERNLLLALEAATQIYNDTQLVAEALQVLTSFYSQMDQYTEAIAQADWCIQMVKKRLGDSSAELEPLYLNMADLQRCDGNEDEAHRYEALAAGVRK